MQTTMTTIWQDIYNDIGIFGIIAIITLYGILSDRYPALRWWRDKKNSKDLYNLYTNHIPHLEQKVEDIKDDVKELKEDLKERIDYVEKNVDDRVKGLHSRMGRIEQRCDSLHGGGQ